jgi:serine/threonine protein kinase
MIDRRPEKHWMHLGKYQFIKKLAAGGMAEVFLAKATGPMGFEKSLVLKRILPHLAEDPHFVEMFFAEARLAAQLNHPNTVQIFDFGESEGSYYLAMEYIDGLNLRALLKSAGSAGMILPPVCCAKIIAFACEGLSFAHDFVDPDTREPLNLVHRDVSPDNILLSRQGAVKVVDFGIAKAANQGHKTQTGMIKGKIAYMPPEQLQGLLLDRRVDVYALGVVLYEMLTGKKPFDAATDVSLMHAILSEPLVPARKRRPDLPQALGQILDRALSKDPGSRYPDCRAFQSDLERFILSCREPVGPWQLSQLVASFSGEAPVLATGALEKRGYWTESGTGADYLSPDTGADAGTGPAGMRSRAASEEEDDVTIVKLEPSVRTSVTEERSSTLNPRGYLKRGVALCCLALFLLGTGTAVLSARASRGSLPASRELSSSGTQPLERPPPPVPPAPEPQSVEEVKQPEVATAPQVPAPSRKTAPVKPASRSKAIRQEEPARPEAQPQALRKGTLEFRIRPYAIIVLNGKQLGPTPLAPVELVAGRHSVQLINSDLHKSVTRTVEVRADQPNIFKFNLLEE